MQDAATRIAELEKQLEERDEVVAQQAEQIEALAALVEKLQEELNRHSGNSSQPPSSDSPSQREKNRQKRKRNAGKRKRGGQKGHKGSHRALLGSDKVDRFEEHWPDVCENCWQPLPHEGYGAFARFQVTELTGKGGVEVVEHRRRSVRCSCGHVTKASWAKMPRSPFGPRLRATVAMLTGSYHLSRRQTKRLLMEMFGIAISLGGISNIEAAFSELLKPGYDQARQAADSAAIKHFDGTGWQRTGKTLQLWTVATSMVTAFCIVADGAASTLRSLFGRIKGILISDRATALNFWAMKRRQICWAHLARKFISFSERAGPAGTIGKELVDYCDVIFATYRAYSDGEISRRVFRKRMKPVRLQVEAVLHKAAERKIQRMSGSCANILEHKEALWTFVDRRGVEPTNNHAERELRAFVLWRKKSFGTQSSRGDRFAERMMTAVHTLRKQQRHILGYLTELQTASCPQMRPTLVAA